MADDIDGEAVHLDDAATLRAWLGANVGRTAGVWLIYTKGARRTLPYDDLVAELIAAGWVDSRPGTVDAQRARIWISPRRARSRWSARNRAVAEALEASGRMTPPGRSAVERARASGNWEALDPVEALEEPDDLRRALDEDAVARAAWGAFPPSARRAILEWILSARRPATRAARIATTVAEAHAGRRANQWRQPGGAGTH